MGTRYVVRVGRLPAGTTAPALRTEVERILEKIDAAMSTYRPDSDISRFNRVSHTDWFAVSAQTRAVVDEALSVAALTDGAFDVTVGPLVELWGFGAHSGAASMPTEPAIRDAMRTVGALFVEARAQPPAIRKLRPEIELDLSAIAKGFAVDALADHLIARGIKNFLVEIGGELRVRGRTAAGDRWRVAIQKPTGEAGVAETVMSVEDMAVATSGDYRHFFTRDGERYSHVIDPRTGRPVAHDLVSVTVADSSAMRADALATGLLVLGPQLGRLLAARLTIPALFVSDGPGGFANFATPAFKELLVHRLDQRRST
jgi:thiamine biosynthesis lipoprotein